MRLFIITIISCLFFVSCGVKDDPKYQTLNNYNKKIKVI